ncbi:MAG: sigma-70 family RNA polymerase sigma factor [Acidobacteriota bacterium]
MAPKNPTPPPEAGDVTELLRGWNEGAPGALDALMPVVTQELRRLASGFLARESRGHTLQPTALVNECYLRLVDRRRVSWQDRAHFFAFAARTMRRILVEHARAQGAVKRGRGRERVTLHDDAAAMEPRGGVDVLDLDGALQTLAAMDDHQHRIVELRFFAGLSIRETAEVLGIAEATVNRRWASARAWLHTRLAEGRLGYTA